MSGSKSGGGNGGFASKDSRGKTASDNIRPSFLTNGNPAAGDGARESLVGGENAASEDPVSTTDGGIDQARSAESSITSKVEGLSPKDKTSKGRGKGIFKKFGPFMLLLVLLTGGGGLLVLSQTLMPFSSVARIIQEFNSMKTVMSKRSDTMLRYQTSSERYRSPTRQTIFRNQKFNISSKQAAKLKSEGIDVIEVSVGGKTRTILAFDDGSGVKQPIVTDTDIGKIDEVELYSALKNNSPDSNFKTTPMSLSDAAEIDGFTNGYLKSSKTWKGAISGWFNRTIGNTLDRLGIDRNRFKTLKNQADIDAGNAAFKQAAENKNKMDADDTKVKTESDNPEVVDSRGGTESVSDGEGGTTNLRKSGDPVTEIADSDAIPKGANKSKVQAALNSKVAKAARAASSIVCGVMAAAGAIHALVYAQQATEILNLVSGYLESVQKVQAGDGDGSPMSEYANALTTKDSSGQSGMSSVGMGGLFGSKTFNLNDQSAQETNSESLMSQITMLGFDMTYSIQDFINCSYAKIAANAIGVVIDIIGIATGGIVTAIKEAGVQILKAAVVSTVVSAFAAFIVPTAAKMLMKSYMTDFFGEDLGNAIISGAGKYLGGAHQGGGGSPGDVQTVLAFRRETEIMIAEEAKYEREQLSPFDVSSQNTFLGSIVYSLTPLATATSSLNTALSGIASLVSSSMVSLLPTAGAIAETDFIVTQGDCPLLESIGIMGDPYCNPYYTSDLTTIELDPGEDIYEAVAERDMKSFYSSYALGPGGDEEESCADRDEDGNLLGYDYAYTNNFDYLEENYDDPGNCVLDVELDKNDNPVIHADSELGKYIVFCGQRSSAWGVADAGISSQLAILQSNTGISALDSIVNGAVGAIPIIGDVLDAVSAAADKENAPWIGGEACVASSTNDKWPNNKYYQRYVEDQNWLESAGLVDQTGVSALLDKYYEQNPLDNSYEGVLARFSGLSKDEVIATLELLEQAEFIANYEPSNLYPMPIEEHEVSLAEQVPNIIIADHHDNPVPQYIIYTDTRNRNHAA